MSREIKFLSRGIFEKDAMQSKVTSHKMSTKEKLFGYALGPGFVAVYVTMITSLREMFYMSVMPLDGWYGSGTYMSLQTIASINKLPEIFAPGITILPNKGWRKK